MKSLLKLQELDLKIETHKAREAEIPKQKSKFDIHRKRLGDEIAEREAGIKKLVLEQRECETDIEQRQNQIKKYDQQLFAVKKNEEYQALLHEIEMLKKQISLKEERILAIMLDMDDLKARLEEDRKRVGEELKEIERQCGEIDAELTEAVAERQALEAQRPEIIVKIPEALIQQYDRLRKHKKTGAVVVALDNETCSGCHMRVRPQIANEVLDGKKILACAHCNRLLYHRDNIGDDEE